MARVVVGNPFENQIPTVSPTANVVDTYVRPAEKSSPFAALAQTLQNIERKATPVLQREEKRRAEKEFAEGQKLWDDTRKQFGEAVKAGIIKEGESPYVRKGYRISNLSSLSAQYSQELKDALDRKKLYTNGNPAAIEAYTKKFKEEFKKKYGINESFGATEVAEYFLPTTTKADQAFAASWREKNVAYMSAKAYDGIRNKLAAYTYSIVDPKLTQEQRTQNANGLMEFIKATAQEAEKDGMNRTKVGDAIGDALRLVALQTQDTTPLDLMAHVQLGTAPLGATYENQLKNLDVTLKINKILEDKRDAKIKQAAAELDAAQSNLFSTASAELVNLTNPDIGVRQASEQKIMDQINALNALGDEDASKLANSMLGLIDSAKSRFDKSDQQDFQAYVSYMGQIQNAANMDEAFLIIKKGLDVGAFTTEQHYRDAMQAAEDRAGTPTYRILEDSTGPVQPILQDVYQQYFSVADSMVSQLSSEDRQRLRDLNGRVASKIKSDVRSFIKDYKTANDGRMPSEDEIYERASISRDVALKRYALTELNRAAETARTAIGKSATLAPNANLTEQVKTVDIPD